MKNYVICGARDAGKTTLAKKIIENSDKRICGFFTQKYPDRLIEGLCPIYIFPSGGDPIFDDEHLVGLGGEGTHYINTEVFDTVGVDLISSPDPDSLIIMDEIGFLECKAEKFQNKVIECLCSDVPTVVMMKQKFGEEFMRRVRDLSKDDLIEYIELTEENRDDVFTKIMSDI